jgi:hypothetical protein
MVKHFEISRLLSGFVIALAAGTVMGLLEHHQVSAKNATSAASPAGGNATKNATSAAGAKPNATG